MKKVILIAILACSISGRSSAQLSFKISKPLCLLTFLETASGDPHMSKTLREYIRNNIPVSDTAAFNKVIRRFSAINIDHSYMLPEYPKSRQKPRSMESLVKMAAVQANDNEDFFRRITGILPNEQWLELKDIMQRAAPYYDKLIWNTQQELLNKQLTNLKKFTNTRDIFNKIKTFYGSTWSDDMPFTVGIYPIHGSRGNTTATPHNNSLVLAVLTSQQQDGGAMGVVFHEISHVFYEEQPLAMQHRLDAIFTKSKSLYAAYAYNYVDEALATACGNGWAQAYLAGAIDTGSWYNDEYINRYAHALYPMVKEYMNAARTMDEPFIERAIAIFEKEFPDAAYSYDNLMNKINLYTDASDNGQFERISDRLNNYYRIYSSQSSYPITHAQSLDMAEHGTGTQVFIVHSDHEQNFKALQKLFPELKNMSFDKESIISFIDKDKRAVIIMNVKNEERIDEGLKFMSEMKKIDTKQRIRAIN